VNLNAGFDRSVSSTTPRQVLLERAVVWLLPDAGLDAEVLPADEEARRRIVTTLLTVRPPRPIDTAALQTLDDLFAADADRRPVVHLAEILAQQDAPFAVPGTRVTVWRGDITTLAVDGIVNAANSSLLGCFKPGHRCIDNAIHAAAGPRLREDCHRIVERQGHDEPTGTAKATRGYYLPAKFVLHTVGPIVSDGRVTPEHREQLASSYEACLDLAAAIGLRSIAFCGVSTGVFGYPKRQAAEVATSTVRDWLERHPALRTRRPEGLVRPDVQR
jgi:O-acetyl-ADP-ribose deacetylase (regulator of RNase III)